MAPGRIQIIAEADGNLKRYGNMLGALGAGKARQAMARAVNRAGRTTAVQVRRALVKQTSIKRAIVNAQVRTKAAAHQGTGAIEFVIWARGSEIPLAQFGARQFSWGVRAKVWGRMQRFPHTFGAPGDNPKVVSALGGQVFVRTSSDRLPIEKVYGPSIPKEMVIGETKEAFESTAARETEKRLAHELGRLLAL